MEFWLTLENKDVLPLLQEVNAALAAKYNGGEVSDSTETTDAVDALLADDLEDDESSEGDDAADSKQPGVTQVPHVPQPPATTRRIVVRNVQRRAGKSSGQRQMVDGDKCESITMAFE